MAQLTSLVNAIAEVEGLDPVQVGWIARYLREAGLISQGGRGKGAAKMTPADAAVLLIGVNAARSAKDAVEAYREYHDAKWYAMTKFPEDAGSQSWDFLSGIFVEETILAEALERLIESAIPPLFGSSKLERIWFDDLPFRFEITFHSPQKKVNVKFGPLSPSWRNIIIDGIFVDFGKKSLEGDRVESVTITHQTILEVGKVLAS